MPNPFHSALFFSGFLAAILILDRVLLPKGARTAWKLNALLFTGAALCAFFPEPLSRLVRWIGITRPVDFVLYLVVSVLVREFFLSRYRSRVLETQITTLARNLAIAQAEQKRLNHD